MSTMSPRRIGISSMAGVALLCTLPMWTAHAADQTIDLPEGIACPDFPLRIEITNNPNRVVKEFTDANGDVVRILEPGKANDFRLTNMTTGRTIFFKGKGSVAKTTVNADGTTTVENNGHTGVVLFPADVPLPGGTAPSTTLYVGRVVYTIDANGIFTVQSASGRTVDICAELT
jgi:hypothetical protein